MTVTVDGDTIALSGTVGDMGGWFDSDPGITASAVSAALSQVGKTKDVTLTLNSGGGIASEGAAVHSVITAHKGKKTIIVQGCAASAASIIAMAGDQIMMAPGSYMMIHDPQGITIGNVAAHEKHVQALNAIADSMAGIYAEKTGKTISDARADMKNEIWLTPEDAVAQNYATGIVGKEDAEDEPEPAAFNYTLYKHPPSEFTALVTMHGWNARQPTASKPQPKPRKGKHMAFTAEQQAEIDREVAARMATKLPTSATMAQADVATIVDACTKAGLPTIAATLIGTAGMTVEKATARIAEGSAIKMACDKAAKLVSVDEGFAAQMINEGRSLHEVSTALFDKITAAQAAAPTSGVIVVPDSKTVKPGGATMAADDATITGDRMTASLKKQGILK